MSASNDPVRDEMTGEDDPQPERDRHGVPWCRDDCKQHDGKRCRLLGVRPSTICEPAVRELYEMAMGATTELIRLGERMAEVLDEAK